jgi:hypothetical protein
MQINHMICPTCGHDFYVDCAYATCDACQTFFYATQSKTSKKESRNLLAGAPVTVHFQSDGRLLPGEHRHMGM